MRPAAQEAARILGVRRSLLRLKARARHVGGKEGLFVRKLLALLWRHFRARNGNERLQDAGIRRERGALHTCWAHGTRPVVKPVGGDAGEEAQANLEGVGVTLRVLDGIHAV